MNEKDKKVDALIKLSDCEIRNDLEQFVSDLDPSEIDGLYGYPNNAGYVSGGDLEIVSYDIEEKGDNLVYKIFVKQFYEVMYAYEDKEGDQIDSGESELYAYATVVIDCNSEKGLKIENMTYDVVK